MTPEKRYTENKEPWGWVQGERGGTEGSACHTPAQKGGHRQGVSCPRGQGKRKADLNSYELKES